MTEGEKLVWAATYAAHCARGDKVEEAVKHAAIAVINMTAIKLHIKRHWGTRSSVYIKLDDMLEAKDESLHNEPHEHRCNQRTE